MKKTVITVMTAVVFCMALSACSGSSKEQEDIKLSVESYKEDHAEVGYVQIAEPKDAAQEKLNQNLTDFYLWQWMYNAEGEADETDYYGTAEYALVGNRLLSVRRYLNTLADGGAYSNSELSAQTFDITTGEPIGPLNAGPLTEEVLGKFKLDMDYEDAPEELKNKAEQAFKDYLLQADEVYNYFLTDTDVVIYIMNDVHAEGDYFIFKAKAADISEVLAAPVKAAFGL